MVVLLAEDVDRNAWTWATIAIADRSSSSRRTWIEMIWSSKISPSSTSSSSRRTWIEIERCLES